MHSGGGMKTKAPYEFADGGAGGATLGAARYGLSGVILANSEEFTHFEECMTESRKPSQTLLDGVKILKSLKKR